MIIKIRNINNNHYCDRCHCTDEKTLTQHYLFYPIGNTKEFDIGTYISVELCSTCYNILLEKDQIADDYAQ